LPESSTPLTEIAPTSACTKFPRSMFDAGSFARVISDFVRARRPTLSAIPRAVAGQFLGRQCACNVVIMRARVGILLRSRPLVDRRHFVQ